jgi:hypothetical protein
MYIDEIAFKSQQRSVLAKRFDANETIFLERELTQLRAKMFEVQFPMPIARTLAPKATDIAPSATTYSYKVYEPIGSAKFINYKSNDIPRVDTVVKEVLGKVVPIGAAYGWDLNELREAARMGTALPEVKARAARDFIERGIDTVLAFGSLPDSNGVLPDVGLNGLVNNSLVTALTVLSGGYYFGGTALDPEVIMAQLNALIAEVGNTSDNTWRVNTLLLPTRHYTYLQQTPFSSLTGESILTVFQRNNPQLTMIQPWYKLNTAGVAGAPRAIAYQRDPMVLEAIIPQEFEVMPPEVQGFEFLHNCHARCGGVKIYQPLAVRYLDFATS